jgi:hypothetical protein
MPCPGKRYDLPKPANGKGSLLPFFIALAVVVAVAYWTLSSDWESVFFKPASPATKTSERPGTATPVAPRE